MKRLKIKLPVSTAVPAGWDDPAVDTWIVLKTEEKANAKQGFFNTLYMDTRGKFFLAALDSRIPEDIRDLPFFAFRQVDTIIALEWTVNMYRRGGVDFCQIDGAPDSLLEVALDLLKGAKPTIHDDAPLAAYCASRHGNN